jgi:hypothetical protein
MTSRTPTLLDPFEIAGIATEWFNRATLPLFNLAVARDVEELSECPPWTPEPVDRRWRARGWTDDDE